jgi:pimeloyl-ACP methyl ester carboxylesterase
MASDMIVRVQQDAFRALDRPDPRLTQPLVVHSRLGEPAQDTVILVHGWGGGRYSTWHRMAALLFSDLPTCDIGLYDYPSGPRRLPGTGPDLERQAANLADSVRDSGYRGVALVCHSLGGLVASRAIVNLIHSQAADRSGRPATDRLAALFLCGSPMAGTRRVPRALRWTTPDFRWLSPHSRAVTEIAKAFADRVVPTPPAKPGQLVLPVYALIGGKDRVVDEFSSRGAIPSDRCLNTVGGHRDLIRPETRDDQGYRWLLNHVRRELGEHAERWQRAETAGTPHPGAGPAGTTPARTRYSFSADTVRGKAEVTGAERIRDNVEADIRFVTIEDEAKVTGAGDVGGKG